MMENFHSCSQLFRKLENWTIIRVYFNNKKILDNWTSVLLVLQSILGRKGSGNFGVLIRWDPGINYYSVTKFWKFFWFCFFFFFIGMLWEEKLLRCHVVLKAESFCLDDSITEVLLILCPLSRVAVFSKGCLCSLPWSFASSSEKVQLQIVILYLHDCMIKLAGTQHEDNKSKAFIFKSILLLLTFVS